MEISESDFEQIYITLSHCRGYHSAEDIMVGFRNLTGNPKPSRLTAEINRTMDLLKKYIEDEDVPEE